MVINRLFLDVGHGPGNGKHGMFDPGAGAFGRTEYGLALQVVREVERLGVPGTELVIAPDVALIDLVKYLNKEMTDGDVLFSIHLNSATSPLATGSEVLIALTSPEIRRAQALVICRELHETLNIRDRGLKFDVESVKGAGRGLPILRNVFGPAFLLELGFISNTNDVMAIEAHGAKAIRNAVIALKEEA